MVTAIVVGALVAGTAISAYSAYQEGQQAAEAAKQQAAWNAYNAQVAQRQAEAERQAALFEAKQQRRKGEMLLARQRALIGVSGVTMEGSPLLVAEDTAAQLALENANIRERGLNRAAVYKSQSILDLSKASAARRSASSYRRAGMYGAGASLLQGTAQAGYMYGSMKGKW